MAETVTESAARVRVAQVSELAERGCMTTKVGSRPVCVFYDDGQVFAVEDRCPHMGFPLHRGTVQGGLLTCHWHHARFDLASGGTLDPFADDVTAYPVEIEDGDVYVLAADDADRIVRLFRRLDEGLEQGITLVIAKAVLDKSLDSQTAFEIVSIDIADIDVGDNVGARLQADQAEADVRVARARAEERRTRAVASEQEMKALTVENRAKVVLAEAEIPRAIAEAYEMGRLRAARQPLTQQKRTE